jgi:FkbM family methyltransferase
MSHKGQGKTSTVAIIVAVCVISLSSIRFAPSIQCMQTLDSQAAETQDDDVVPSKPESTSRELQDSRPIIFPPTCTEAELQKIAQIIPGNKVRDLTRCFTATWLDDYLHDEFFNEEYYLQDSSALGSLQASPIRPDQTSLKRALISIFLGCNKGDDAVEVLRKLSGDVRIQVDAFSQAVANHSHQETNNAVMRRFCPAAFSTHPITSDACIHPFVRNSQATTKGHMRNMDQEASNDANYIAPSHVYCVEAMPINAKTLQNAVTEFPEWNSHFTVSHAAMGREDGEVMFPSVQAKVGVEELGIGHCSRPQALKRTGAVCENVPMYTLDSYVKQHILPNAEMDDHGDWTIDYLSVDVEGYDWEVLGLGGSNKTLPHVRYLEFEFHAVGAWRQYKLEGAVSFLRDFGFVCYYAGFGRLWRLTDCFQPYYNVHVMANVACVNLYLQPRLAHRMESLFQKELVTV